MKLYVVVEICQLIVSGVYVTEDLADAKRKFKEYTGVDFDEFKAKWEAIKDATSEELRALKV